MKHIFNLLILNILCTSSYSQPKLIEVNHYLFPEFTKGSILFKNSEKKEALLNYNSVTEEMIFLKNENKLALAGKQLALVDTVFVNKRKFITQNTEFIELIYHANWQLFLEHKCDIQEPGTQAAYGGTSQLSSTKSVSSLGAGQIYELELPNDYKAKPYFNYLLQKDGDLVKFSNLRQLKKLYAGKENLFKDFTKKNRVKYNNKESIIQLIEHLEAN